MAHTLPKKKDRKPKNVEGNAMKRKAMRLSARLGRQDAANRKLGIGA